MLKSKYGLVVAILTLMTMPTAASSSVALGADLAADRENLAYQNNPALPSPDDLVSFDDSLPAAIPANIDSLGANQSAFPLFYGAPAAAPGTLIAVAPTPSTTQGATIVDSGLVASAIPHDFPDSLSLMEKGKPILSPDGLITRTYVSMPVPAPDEKTAFAQAGYLDYRDYIAQKQTGSVQTDAPRLPVAPGVAPTITVDSSVASAVPHSGAGAEPAPPTLGAKVDPGDMQPVAAATATMAMVPASGANGESATQVRTSAPGTPTLRPIPPEPAEKPAAVAAVEEPAPEPAPAAKIEPERSGDRAEVPAEPHFPPATIAPPPLPAELASNPGDDSHPTVGLAEFKTDRALDGTPLPPPPPMPELPGRQPEVITAPSPDPSQVRADFNRLKAFCEEDSLGSAAELYARMPDFGKDEEINRLRADAANLLILGLARSDNLRAARRIFDSVPTDMPGYDANLAKTRGVINLATYYVRAERFNDAYDVLMDLAKIENRSALNNELFRLMARMIPYLDNADESDKATRVYDMLLGEVKSPGTASLFADNIHGVLKYFLHYVDKSENPVARRRRMDFLEHMYSSMEKLKDNPEIRLVRGTVGMSLADRYAGDPDRAARFLE